MLPLLGLLSLITVLVVVSRIATVTLEATGMARDGAAFQARSALLGVGFTTSEAEDITSHPVRRRVVLYLMTIGNAGVVAGIGGFLLAFLGAEAQQTLRRSGLLVGGIVGILLAFHTSFADRIIRRSTRALLNRYSTLDTSDYAALLRVERDYAISEIHVRHGEWLVGRPLAELHLTKEGVVVLGVHRADGQFVGAPTGDTVMEDGDDVVAYGQVDILRDLAMRPASTGDMIHDQVVDQRNRSLNPDS